MKTGMRKNLLPFVLGMVLGAMIVGVALVYTMPTRMISVGQSRFDTVDATVDALSKAATDAGWVVVGQRNMNQSMAAHGQIMDRPVRIVEICHPGYAKSILEANPEMSTMMPCAWGVYEQADGSIAVSGMNMGLMGRLFGGTIAEVMSGPVARDEHQMLQSVLQ